MLRSGLRNLGVAKFFLTDYEVFEYPMKHSIILGQEKFKAKVDRVLWLLRISIICPNLLHGFDMLVFYHCRLAAGELPAMPVFSGWTDCFKYLRKSVS